MNICAVSDGEPDDLSISVVVYRPNEPLLSRTLASLAQACTALDRSREGKGRRRLFLINNGGLPDGYTSADDVLAAANIEQVVVTGHGNIGYGRGHNLAIVQALSHYHLILNPDIDLDPDALRHAVEFLDSHPEVGLLAPAVVDDAGQLQYLCRQYPTVFDLFIRGFLPGAVRHLFSTRLAHYEMRTQINTDDLVWDPPIVSGCFMLFRTEVLKNLSGFDPRYFLYFEDYDLSLRTRDVARIVYLPAVRVLHHGGGAARKGGAHIRMFMASAFRFFNRFGWKLL